MATKSEQETSRVSPSVKGHISKRSATAESKREIEVYESPYDTKRLLDNKWNFQIAKSVTDGNGRLTFNVIWQSRSIAPRTKISWNEVYALNWTATVPAEGVSVSIMGNWQPCLLGDAYDLLDTGFWSEAPNDGARNYMTVSQVKYKYPGVDGIHIVVGIQNADEGYDIIYIDPTALAPGSRAKYQPQGSVRWWYQADIRTATMISSASTAIGTVDLSQPAPATNKYYYSTTYRYQSGAWVTSQDQPSRRLYSPSTDSQVWASPEPRLYNIARSILKVIFSIAIGSSEMKGKVAGGLKNSLEVKYKDVEVKFSNDYNLGVQVGVQKRAKTNSIDEIATAEIDISTDVDEILDGMKGNLPNNESWTIKKEAA